MELLKEIIKKWAESEPLIKEVYIFGSRARNDYRENSDIDIAVKIEKRPNDDSPLATWFYEGNNLKNRLSKLLPYELQLEYLDNKTKTVLSGIKESSILVYKRQKPYNPTPHLTTTACAFVASELLRWAERVFVVGCGVTPYISIGKQ